MSDKTDLTLGIDDIAPEDLSKVWERLSSIAHGFALDGHEVSLHTYHQRDDGEFDVDLAWTAPDEEIR